MSGNYLDLFNIKFNDPYSLKKDEYLIHFIDYKNTSILLQLPQSTLQTVNSDVMVIKFGDNQLKEFLIDPLEKFIKDTVFSNSYGWFGKKFTMNKINNCFTSPYNNDECILSIEQDTLFNKCE